MFVLGMEPEAVAAHVELANRDLAVLPGPGRPRRCSIGWRFLDKIVQLPVTLPAPHADRDLSTDLRTVVGLAPDAEPARRPDSNVVHPTQPVGPRNPPATPPGAPPSGARPPGRQDDPAPDSGWRQAVTDDALATDFEELRDFLRSGVEIGPEAADLL